jgi:hypothetical protein
MKKGEYTLFYVIWISKYCSHQMHICFSQSVFSFVLSKGLAHIHLQSHTRTRWKSIPYSVVKQNPFSLYGESQWSWLKKLTSLCYCTFVTSLVHQFHSALNGFTYFARLPFLFSVPGCVYSSGFQSSILSIVSRLRTGGSGVQIPIGARHFSLLQNVLTSSGPHPASYSMGTGVLSQG